MRRLLLFLLLALPVWANTVYLSQSGGTFSGGSACNGQTAQAYTYFSSSGNWTTGTPTGNQIGPGTTVYICGTITAPQSTSAPIFQFQNAGTSGNLITLKWDTGAIVQSPAFYEGVEDYQNYTVVDGGTNGIIQNTNNGTGKTYNQGSESVNIAGSNITVQNLTIQNICLRSAGDNGTSDTCASGSFGSTGITCNPSFGPNPGCSNILITRNTISKPGDTGMEYDPINGDSNITISYNTITGVNFGIAVVSTGSAFTTSGLSIIGNDISCTVNAACIWDDPAGSWHHDGIILFPGASGSSTQVMNNVVIANNYMHDMQSSTNASVCGSAPPGGAGCVTANIFIDPGGNGSLPGLQIYNNVVTSSSCSGACNGPSNGGIAVGNSNSVAYTAFVYNNTCSDAANGRNCFSLDYSGSKGENNVAVGSQYYFWSDVSSPSGLTVDYNDHYNQSVGVNNNGCPGCDTHSISTNPTLNADYTLPSTSPARGAGVNLTSLGITDLDTGAPQYFGASYACGSGCVARPSSGAWDIGAYPFASGSQPNPALLPILFTQLDWPLLAPVLP